MTRDQMHIKTLDELRDLSPVTKAELRALIANKIQIIEGNAELIYVNNVGRWDDTGTCNKANTISEAGRMLMADIDKLIGGKP